MNPERASAPTSPRLLWPGAGNRILFPLLIFAVLLLPPLFLFAAVGLFLVLIVVCGAPAPGVVCLAGALSSGISPRSPPLPA